MMQYAFSFLNGRSVVEMEKIINNFLEENLKGFIYKEAIDIIKEHKEKKREILLVSNSLEIIVKKVSDFLGIKNYIGTKLETVNNKFTGKILGNIVYGSNKINLIQEFIKNNNLKITNSWAYTDHISDSQLLKSTSNSFVVNANRKLFKEANKNKWRVLKFSKTLI